MRKKILFIGGSLNQTTIAHEVYLQLHQEYDCFFTPYYSDGILGKMADAGLLDFTVLGGPLRRMTETFLKDHNLQIDFAGRQQDYDLIVTTSDLLIQKNLRNKRVVLIQEGMTDPENLMYHLVKRLGLPRFLASTSVTGLSHSYNRFCVASHGYRDLFIRKGVAAEKLVITGIPNFDNIIRFRSNSFPHSGYVLVATSDARETLKFDDRRKFILQSLKIAGDRPLFFKLHPNENSERATREIKQLAPQAVVFDSGNTNHMIANCEVLITQYSSVVYVGLALDKEVHSYFDLEELKRLMPWQNGGESGQNIAQVCRKLLEKDAYPAMIRPPANQMSTGEVVYGTV